MLSLTGLIRLLRPDPAPETPILPEDAPNGVPNVILIEIPLGAKIVVPPKEDEDKE